MTQHTLWAMRTAGRVPPAMLWLATAPEGERPVTQPAAPGESRTLLLATPGQGGAHHRHYALVVEIAPAAGTGGTAQPVADVSAMAAALGAARDAGFTKVDIALAPAEHGAGHERVALALARHLGFTQVTARHRQCGARRRGPARAPGSLQRALRLAQALAWVGTRHPSFLQPVGPVKRLWVLDEEAGARSS